MAICPAIDKGKQMRLRIKVMRVAKRGDSKRTCNKKVKRTATSCIRRLKRQRGKREKKKKNKATGIHPPAGKWRLLSFFLFFFFGICRRAANDKATYYLFLFFRYPVEWDDDGAAVSFGKRPLGGARAVMNELPNGIIIIGPRLTG